MDQRESPTWDHVSKFADAMERKLSQNRHKGDREGWLRANLTALWSQLEEEVSELADALATGPTDHITDEAADVANLAMMIADWCATHFAPSQECAS